jgi:diketogulonate reductase-like aldo/keto reductase
MAISRTIKLNDGRSIPSVGLGVWKIPDGQPVQEAVGWALEAGYHHIDTAKLYGNERGVGVALRASQLKREDVWVTTKLWPTQFTNPHKALSESLQRLDMNYVDLYLVHFPVPGFIKRTWRALEELREAGLAKSIGVSNYSIHQLDELLGHAEMPPAVNQIKVSPFGYDAELLAFAAEHKVTIQAYSPLTHGRRLDDSAVKQIAAHHGRSPAQVLIRWSLQKGLVVLPKSQNKGRIADDLKVFDFDLSVEQMHQLDELNG